MDGFAIRIHMASGNSVLNHQFDTKLDSVGSRHFAKALQGILQQFFRADPLDIEPLLARFDAGQSQQNSSVRRVMRAEFLRMISINSRT